MKEQMKKAGILPADERLAKIADDCYAQNKKNMKTAETALWLAISNDPALLLKIFEPFKKEATRRTLEAARIRASQSVIETQNGHARTGSGPGASDVHTYSAAPSLSSDAISTMSQDHVARASDQARGHPSIETLAPDAPRPSPVTDRMKQEGLTMLDRFKITQRVGDSRRTTPIGDIFIAEFGKLARDAMKHAWVNDREREVILILQAQAKNTARIPEGARVRDIFTPADILSAIEQATGKLKLEIENSTRSLAAYAEAAHA